MAQFLGRLRGRIGPLVKSDIAAYLELKKVEKEELKEEFDGTCASVWWERGAGVGSGGKH